MKHFACLLSFLIGLSAFAQDPAPEASAEATPTVAVPPSSELDAAQLRLMLRPLPKEELKSTSDAWFAHLQKVASSVSNKGSEGLHAESEELKKQLGEEEVALREEQTKVIDSLNLILKALDAKALESDAEIETYIAELQAYMNSVSGLQLDAQSGSKNITVLRAWLLSAEGGQRLLKNILIFIAIIVIARILSRIGANIVKRVMSKVPETSTLLVDVLSGFVKWIIMSVGIIMGLSALEISIAPLLAVLGAAGFVVAFALQDSLSNFASGIMILGFRPYDVDDVIEAGGVAGKVSAMNLVSTTLTTFDNKTMIVPNNKIWNDIITNATGVKVRRVDLEFGIGYSDDIDKAKAVLEDIVSKQEKVLQDPEPTVKMHSLGDSSVNFICRPWCSPADYWDVYWDITREVKLRFDAEGISIPFPQRDVHLFVEEGKLS